MSNIAEELKEEERLREFLERNASQFMNFNKSKSMPFNSFLPPSQNEGTIELTPPTGPTGPSKPQPANPKPEPEPAQPQPKPQLPILPPSLPKPVRHLPKPPHKNFSPGDIFDNPVFHNPFIHKDFRQPLKNRKQHDASKSIWQKIKQIL